MLLIIILKGNRLASAFFHQKICLNGIITSEEQFSTFAKQIETFSTYHPH